MQRVPVLLGIGLGQGRLHDLSGTGILKDTADRIVIGERACDQPGQVAVIFPKVSLRCAVRFAPCLFKGGFAVVPAELLLCGEAEHIRGRSRLLEKGCDLKSLAVIKSMEGGKIVFADEADS